MDYKVLYYVRFASVDKQIMAVQCTGSSASALI